MTTVLVILLIAVCRLSRAYRGKDMASEYIAAGAIVGSLIAALFRKSSRWLFQVFSGSWIGYVSATWLQNYMEWPTSDMDYHLLAGTIMGCIGYSILEAVLSPELRDIIKKRFVGGEK